MKRPFLILTALLGLSASAPAQTRALPPGEIRANGDITFGDALKLGKREGTGASAKTIITPDTLRILGPDSTGDVSAMTAAPNTSAAFGTLSRLLADRQTTAYLPDLGPGIVGAQRSVTEALDAGYIDARALGFRSCLFDCTSTIMALNDIAAANLNTKLSAIGGSIFFRRGIWLLSRTVSIVDRHFGIIGEGEGRTIFQFSGTGHLFDVSQSSLFYRIEFRNFTAWASSTGADQALRIVRPRGLNSTQNGPNIRNIEFIGSDTSKFQWQTGIDCTGCWNLNVTENLFQGKDNAFSADFLILRDRSTPPTIVNNKVFSANRAVWSPPGSFVEGLIAVANQFVGVMYGVFLDDGVNAPGAQIIGNHINSFRGGVVSIAHPQVMISKNLFYRYGDASTGYDWVGVYLGPASSDASLEDNSFYGYRGSYPGTATAVKGAQSTAGSVFGGMFADCDIGLDASNSWTLGYDRIKTRNVTKPVRNIPTGSYAGSVWAF